MPFQIPQFVTDQVIAQVLSLLVTYGLPFLGVLLLAVAGQLIKENVMARKAAQVTADIADFLTDMVEEAESRGVPGDFKYAWVAFQAKKELDRLGVKGDSRRLVEEYLPDAIEDIVRFIFPKAPQAA